MTAPRFPKERSIPQPPNLRISVIIVSGGPTPNWGASLREWRETMEAVAEQHGWEAPSGYDLGNWPRFEIVQSRSMT